MWSRPHYHQTVNDRSTTGPRIPLPARRPVMRRQFPIAVAAALAALAIVPTTASAAPATATFTKVQDWGTGFEGKFTITNGTTSAINGWTVAFDLPAGFSITSSWDAVRGGSGQHFTFGNPSWAPTLP